MGARCHAMFTGPEYLFVYANVLRTNAEGWRSNEVHDAKRDLERLLGCQPRKLRKETRDRVIDLFVTDINNPAVPLSRRHIRNRGWLEVAIQDVLGIPSNRPLTDAVINHVRREVLSRTARVPIAESMTSDDEMERIERDVYSNVCRDCDRPIEDPRYVVDRDRDGWPICDECAGRPLPDDM